MGYVLGRSGRSTRVRTRVSGAGCKMIKTTRSRRQRETAYDCGAQIRRILCDAALRLTRQRIELAKLMERSDRRLVTAEMLYFDALNARSSISRAMICNTLREFERIDVVRRTAVPYSKKVWFTINLQRRAGAPASKRLKPT